MVRQKLFKLFRALISFALAAFMVNLVIKRTGADPIALWHTVDRTMMALAFGAFGVGVVLAAFRWMVLLGHVGVPLTYPVVLRLTFIGLFFNLFVPGGVGGDLIKMVYLRKDAGENYAEAILTVLLDRILGLAGLLSLAVLGLFLNQELLMTGSPQMRGMLIAVGIASVGALLGGLLFFCWPMLGSLGKRLTKPLEKAPEKLVAIAHRVAQALDLLRKAPGRLAALLGLAMVGHLFATFGVMMVGTGLKATGLSFADYLLSTQLANLVAAIPITPGGVGGRDLAMAFLLESCGATPELTGSLPIAMTAILISWSALGGLALLWERKTGVAVPQEVSQG